MRPPSVKPCPRCNQWRTPDQMTLGFCDACRCTIPGCTRVIKNRAHRWCDTHYRRWRDAPHLPVDRQPQNTRLCAYGGCTRMAYSLALCDTHYRQQVRRGWLSPIRQQRPAKHQAAEVIEEVELLLGTDTPDSIARRLGYKSVPTLQRVLTRASRGDLASKLTLYSDPTRKAA